MSILEREEGVSYRYYYKYPFVPDKKKPVVVTKDKTIAEIYPPDKPYSSNIVWVWVSTDKITQTMYQLSPGAFFGPPDAHAGDEMYYVMEGILTVLCPETGTVNEVHQGEALLIPKDSYHQGYNFTDKIVKVLCCIAPLMWDLKKGPAPPLKEEAKVYENYIGAIKKKEEVGKKSVLEYPWLNIRKSIDLLGHWPIDGEEARKRKDHIKIDKSRMLTLVHGKTHPMLVRFYVSNNLVHMGEFELPSGGEGPRTSEPETHRGDETLYAESGPITVFLPDRLDAYEVPEGAVMLIPEGLSHQYQNFTGKMVKGIFSIAPGL
jgi:quercetin dioxygenase-like cupin family protein